MQLIPLKSRAVRRAIRELETPDCNSQLLIRTTRMNWKAHDLNRPRPPVIEPSAEPWSVEPSSDAVVLFDGTEKSLENWESQAGGSTKWIVRDGALEAVPGSGYVFTRMGFGDCQLHIEWAAPLPAEGVGQGRGNSGLFFMGLYEIQILDSYQNDTYPDGQAGSIYGQHPPLVNACRPPGHWQSYDLVFRRPHFRPDGSLLQPARVTLLHNGVLVQDAAELWGPTGWLQHDPYQAHGDRLPLSLQDHGNPVRFRNIWLRAISETAEVGSTVPTSEPVVRLTPVALTRYVGRYETEQGTACRFRIREVLQEHRLQCALYGDRWLDLVPHSTTEFSFRWTAGRIEFSVENEGTPASVWIQVAEKEIKARKVD